MSDDLAEFRDEWQAAISKLIARAWNDQDFKRVLIEDPVPWLHEEGLYFPEQYQVEFYEDPSASPGEWHSVGRGRGAVHRFPIPPPPEVDRTNQDELHGIDASSLACCCPCASCTGAVSHQTWS